ncbi:hypothetical protein [Rheinheimera sp.]|uniref:hypothetical protein n=1 Tax=Rheinheimera sp. TaxID=1869214 RepID=UPI0040488846
MKTIIFAVAVAFCTPGLVLADNSAALSDADLQNVVSAIVKLKVNCSVNNEPECKTADAVMKLLKHTVNSDGLNQADFKVKYRQRFEEAVTEGYIEALKAQSNPN